LSDHDSTQHDPNVLRDAFFALRHGLPRQAPGSDATTRRMLEAAGPLPERPRVLDLGCGPGRSSLLSAAAGAEVTAVDLHEPFPAELRAAAAAQGLGHRIRTVRAGMGALDLPDGSFDLVWAESAVSAGGFDRALAEWRRLLSPGGTLVVTACGWTTEKPPAGARAFRDPHDPLRTVAANTAAAVAAGYHVLGVVPQPESDWDAYLGPLGERAGTMDTSVPGMTEAVAAARAEITLRREHGGDYGSTGFVLRPADPRWRTRAETAADHPVVREILTAAFETPAEAGIVDALRADEEAWLPGLGRVAEAPDGTVAAYALLTRCRVDGVPAAALAPVAVAPAYQRTGAGQAVVRAALDAARLSGERLVLVLGHPAYYPRFGFVQASTYGIRPAFDVPDEAMMALDLDGSGAVAGGTIWYPAAFGV
jgi:predicted N-acetyltransferase YhbS/SAM-dependent methyltransferase